VAAPHRGLGASRARRADCALCFSSVCVVIDVGLTDCGYAASCPHAPVESSRSKDALCTVAASRRASTVMPPTVCPRMCGTWTWHALRRASFSALVVLRPGRAASSHGAAVGGSSVHLTQSHAIPCHRRRPSPRRRSLRRPRRPPFPPLAPAAPPASRTLSAHPQGRRAQTRRAWCR